MKRGCWLVAVLVLGSLGCVGQVAAPSVSAALAKTFAADVVYGEVGGTQLKLDVYRPADGSSGLRPAVIMIHGGGWTSYDKSSMGAMAKWLARNGYVAFSIDYRLLKGSTNQWPVQLDDAQRAVRWIRANAAAYGVDPKKIGAFGHSAGAQMAALLGEVETRDNSDKALAEYSSKVQAVMEMSGPTDFLTITDVKSKGLLTQLMGGTETEKPEAWKVASPALMVGKDTAPFLIMHGTKDDLVPMAQSEEFAAALEKASVPVTLIKVDDGHSFATPEAIKRMAVESVAFFDKTLRR